MIIDTNVYSQMNRGKEAAVQSVLNAKMLYLPFCVVGELFYGFNLGDNKELNYSELYKFMSSECVELLNPNITTAKVYGELSKHCKLKGRVLSNNDLWIAALASEHNIPLVTYDKDFLALIDRLGEKLVLLED